MHDDPDHSIIEIPALYAASNTGLMPRPKTSVFRYVAMRSPEAWKHLETTVLRNTLPLAPAKALNDPFEASPVLLDDSTTAEIAAFVEQLFSRNGNGSAKLDFEALNVQDANGSVLKPDELAQHTQTLLQSLIELRNSQCHIASFSRRISSELQWSHYADGYKGIAYHFVPGGGQQTEFRFLKSVSYTRQRPIIFVSELMEQLSTTPTSNKFVLSWLSFEQRSFLTKSAEWGYEEEERVIKQNVSTLTFSDSELVSIIVGPRFPPADIDRLKRITTQRKRPIKIFRARTSPTDYSIEIDWSKPL
jgi:hypothetical protein